MQCAHIFDGYEAVVAPDARPGNQPVAGHEPDTRSGVAPQHSSASAADVFKRKPSDVPVASTAQNTPTHSIGAMPSVVRGRREFTISDKSVAARPARPEPSLNVSDTATSSPASGVADTPEHVIASPDTIQLRAESEHVQVNTDPIRLEPDHLEHGPDHVSIDFHERGGRGDYAEDRHDKDDAAPFWRSLMSIVWGVLIIAGILVLAIQALYVFRVQLAENIPVLRPGLERMCTALNCTVAYSRQADMIVITQSSLQPEPAENDDASSDTVVLQLTMRNVHDSPQEWPMLILDLKDFSGALIARKHLPKDVYLPANAADTPFFPNAERVVVLPLTMQGLQVNGYQLTAVFP